MIDFPLSMPRVDFVLTSEKTTVLTKQQYAYQSLRKQILSGELKPGDRIIIDTVAGSLEMSPIPVREAISQLAREGLIAIRAHASAVVTDVPLHTIEEIFALLEALQLAAARLSLSAVDDACLAELSACCDRMEAAGELSEWVGHNRQFHEALPRYANLERITEMLVKTGEDWERLRQLNFAGVATSDMSHSNAEHRELLGLLKDRKLRPVEKWIREHNRRALKQYLSYRS